MEGSVNNLADDKPEQLDLAFMHEYEPIQQTLGGVTYLDVIGPDTKYDQPPPLPDPETMTYRFNLLYERAMTDDEFESEAFIETYPELNLMCRLWADEEVNRDIFRAEFDYRSVAAVIATLSPREEWVRNCQRALRFVQKDRVAGMGRAMKDLDRLRVEDADDVIMDPNKNNPKIRAFYNNIANPEASGYVTVDSHMFNIAHDDPSLMGHLRVQRFPPKQYIEIQNALTILAEHLETPPLKLQSVLWYYWKKVHNIKDKSGIKAMEPLPIEGLQYLKGVRPLIVI